MDKSKKILALAMSGAMCFSSCVPAFAASSNVNSVASVVEDSASETVTGKDTSQGTETKYNTVTHDDIAQADVYVTQKSSFTVKIPKVIVLNGKVDEENSGIYQVDVSGNIAGDEAITVIPTYDLDDADATHFEMSQKGKDNITATVAQDKNVFTYATGVTESGKDTTTGKVTATGMTAGSWHGVFNFEIENNTEPKYYSSFNQAVLDSQNNTYDNADLQIGSDENAEAAVLNLADGSSLIRLCSDVDDAEAVTLSKDTTINLNDNELTFADGNGIVANKGLSIYNGDINFNNTPIGIKNPANGTFNMNLKDLNIASTSTDPSITNVMLYSRAGSTNLTNVDAELDSVSKSTTTGFVFKNPSATENTITNTTLDIKNTQNDFTTAMFTNGIQNSGKTIINSFTGVVDVATVGQGMGSAVIYNTTDGNITINDASAKYSINKVPLNTKTSGAYALWNTNGATATVYGGTYYSDIYSAENTWSDTIGHEIIAIGIDNGIDSTMTIKDKNKIDVWGLHSGLESDAGSKLSVNGGTYKSTSHGGIYLANGSVDGVDAIELKNIECINSKNGPLYETHDSTIQSYIDYRNGSAYFGTDNKDTAPWTVNCTNCKFINEQGNSVVLKASDTYIPPTVNFYNCYLFGTINDLRVDNGGTANLYGTTKLAHNKVAFNNYTNTALGVMNDYR